MKGARYTFYFHFITMMPEHEPYKNYADLMLDCGDEHNRWVAEALNYLPCEVFEKYKGSFVFTSTVNRDACRVARHYCETREVILLSERILPSQKVTDVTHPKARYFIYVVLHEVAHAIKNHKSPMFDHLTNEECEAQELEADELAMSWFNDYVAKLNNKYLLPITVQEIEAAQAANRELMAKLIAGEN